VVKRCSRVVSTDVFDCEDDRDRGNESISEDVEKVESQEEIDENIV
jgi:hypothetical protein